MKIKRVYAQDKQKGAITSNTQEILKWLYVIFHFKTNKSRRAFFDEQ